MKKFLTIFTIIVAVMLTASCQKELPDEIKNVDVSQGDKTSTPTSDDPMQQGDSGGSPNQSLEGTWIGNMYISSYYGGRTYNSTNTMVTFLKDPYTYSSGTGYWVDNYSAAPWDYIANHIEWKVDSGDIIIYFREEETSVSISDYHLDDNLFYGTLKDNGDQINFVLNQISSPDWSRYIYWGYNGWPIYY